MNFEESNEQKLIRRTTAAFVKKYCNPADVRNWDRTGEFPEPIYVAMANAGLLAMMVPAQYGGIGSPIADCAIALQEIARPSVDFATRLALIGWGAMILADFASEEIKSDVLPKVVEGKLKLSFSLTEPGSGSDAASLQTKARRDGDSYVISGQKLYSSGAHAPNNMIVLAARTNPDVKKHAGISLFLVPNDLPGITINRLDVVGRRILGLCEVFFDEVRLPKRMLIGEENSGWTYINKHLERERILLAANYLGNTQAALDDAVRYAQERKQFGKPIAEFQAIAHMLSDMATDVEAARWITASTAWRYDQGQPCVKQACMAKLFVSEVFARVTTQGMQILGGAGYTHDHDMQRYWRDARNATVGGGTSQIQRSLIARELGL